jgi:hypothetical protein
MRLTFIDKEKWALAGWRSVGFIQHPNGTPGLGIVFKDMEEQGLLGRQVTRSADRRAAARFYEAAMD